MTQVGIKPPHFVCFCNDAKLFHFSYQRYLENCLRNTFGLEGTPITLSIRQRGEKEGEPMLDSFYLAPNAVTGPGPLGILLVAAIAYFCGCFNGAVIVSKYILRDDVRNHGSGNAGLTNFYRTFGGPLTFVVILCDVLKAVVAVLLGSWLLGSAFGQNGYADSVRISSMWALFGEYWAALFCLLGHMFPCMFHFKGGKGILSGGTIVWMIDWRIGLVVWVGFLLLFLLTKYVSLGSVWAGASFPFATWYFYPDPVIVILAFILGGLVLWKHRGNIVRLIHGNENKFSVHRKKDKS